MIFIDSFPTKWLVNVLLTLKIKFNVSFLLSKAKKMFACGGLLQNKTVI